MAIEDFYGELPKFLRNFRHTADPNAYWLDHFEKRKEKSGHHVAGKDGACRTMYSGYNEEDGYVYISQPYFQQHSSTLTMEKLERLISQCKERNISFDILPFSDHYPGCTIMPRWYPDTDKDKKSYRKTHMDMSRFERRTKKLFETGTLRSSD